MLRILACLFATLFSTFAGAAEPIVGHWIYVHGMTGTSTAYVYGHLILKADGTYTDDRRIGTIVGSRAGPYRLAGERLTLISDGGRETQTFTYFIGRAQDSKGVAFDALTLQGTNLSYLLSRSAD